MVVRVAVYCTDNNKTEFEQGISQFAKLQDIRISQKICLDYQEFLGAIYRERNWDFLIVAVPGARGMEAVISARQMEPEMPLLWCSDDAEFAVASYRYRCTLFMQLPANRNEIEKGMYRCIGNKYTDIKKIV